MQARFWISIPLIFFCLLASCLALAAVPAPRASVDRTVVTLGDSLTLSIRIDSASAGGEPDYSALQRDFEVYSAGSSSQSGIANGRFYSTTDYQLTLIPKRSGQLQIPPLAVAGAQTQPITIQVNPAQSAGALDNSEPVFVDVELDRDSAYVQQQILLTARVYIAVQLRGDLSKPEVDNAQVVPVAESTFMTTINGTRYEVLERKFALFAREPGELTIPELVFNGVEMTSRRSVLDFPGRGRPLRKMSRQLRVQIKPIPASFRGTVWLPARNLTLTEIWNGDQQHLAVGDSITRSIAIRADGLPAAQLPTLDTPQLDSAKLYADQPKLDETLDADGVHGKRVENAALIPTRAGTLQLSETRVIWWDVESDSEKTATLPAQTLAIAAGNAGNATAPAAPSSNAQTHTSQASAVDAEPAAQTAHAPAWWWQIATAALALLWLVTLFAYLRLRRQRVAREHDDGAAPALHADEAASWQAFAAACRANDPAQARQHLLRWCAQHYRDDALRSSEQLQQRADSAELTRELQILDNHLFGTLRDSGEWNGENLLHVVQHVKMKKPRRGAVSSEVLPPLYPAA